MSDVRRRHKLRLLRDLVSEGLYVVRTDALAEKLMAELDLRPDAE